MCGMSFFILEVKCDFYCSSRFVTKRRTNAWTTWAGRKTRKSASSTATAWVETRWELTYVRVCQHPSTCLHAGDRQTSIGCGCTRTPVSEPVSGLVFFGFFLPSSARYVLLQIRCLYSCHAMGKSGVITFRSNDP